MMSLMNNGMSDGLTGGLSDGLADGLIDGVREYYGKTLQSNKDLQTSACCIAESPPEHLRDILREVRPEVLERFYGCGSPIPPELEGRTVLDLGSGSGRDCFVLSKLVGEKGRVIGIDMTEEQIEVARRHVGYHMDRFRFSRPNVEFRHAYIEDLGAAGIETGSVDVVVSNCVLNLSPAKDRVFSEIFRVLKPGGELYFSDVFADRRVPEALALDPLLRGECLGGALYVEDFRRLLSKVGCDDFRVISSRPIAIENPEIQRKAGMIGFHSRTVRAFKLDLEDKCEDYGQVAYYKGTIETAPHAFVLDDHHRFVTGQPMLVCGNTASMLRDTRYARHFEVIGSRATHFGLFACAPGPASSPSVAGQGGAPCC